MSSSPSFGAVIFAKDPARVAKFYEDLVPMTVTRREPDHVVLESPVAQLVVHAIPRQIADSIEIASPPERRTQTPIKLFFAVESLAGVRARAAALGAALDAPEREWEWEGCRICDGHDPEGNVVQFRQGAR
jgi:predicted enzyme related to lactoylglutathione lyase